MSISFRKLTTDDIDAVMVLEKTAYDAEHPQGPALNQNGRYMPWFITLDQEIAFGAFDGDRLAGYIYAKDNNPGPLPSRYSLEGLVIDPEFRRQNIGRQLTQQILNEIDALETGVSVTLSVGQSNQGAQSLYKQFGFIANGNTHQSAEGPYITMVREVPEDSGLNGALSP